MTSELSRLERDYAAAMRADSIYAADTPLSRGSLLMLEALAAECVRYVNRNGGKAAEPVSIGKGGNVKALQAALAEADERIDTVERAWPTFEASWSAITGKLDNMAKAPRVEVHERITPDNAPRALPVSMVTSLTIPQRESLHSTGPGSQFLLVEPDAVGLIFALLRPQVEELLKAKLEKLYESAPLIMTTKERTGELKAAKAAKLTIERKLSELFWTGAAPATVLTWDTDPRAILG